MAIPIAFQTSSRSFVEGTNSLKGHQDAITCVDVSPDGRRVLSSGDNGTVRYWDTDTAQQQKLFQQAGFVRAEKFSLDDRIAFSAVGGRSEGEQYILGANGFPIRLWSQR